MVRGKRRCLVMYPSLNAIDKAVKILREQYPTDPIEWKGGGREQVEQAIAAAKWAFRFSKGAAMLY